MVSVWLSCDQAGFVGLRDLKGNISLFVARMWYRNIVRTVLIS